MLNVSLNHWNVNGFWKCFSDLGRHQNVKYLSKSLTCHEELRNLVELLGSQGILSTLIWTNRTQGNLKPIRKEALEKEDLWSLGKISQKLKYHRKTPRGFGWKKNYNYKNASYVYKTTNLSLSLLYPFFSVLMFTINKKQLKESKMESKHKSAWACSFNLEMN